MFVRNESFRSFLQLYPIVSAIVAIHLALYFLTFLTPELMQFGVGANYLVDAGEYWRLVTPIFFHAGFGHMLFNSFSLVLFGPELERRLGTWKFLLAYVGTGVMANMATYLLEPPHYTHLGSSGAIFGLFGIYLYLVFYRKDLIDQANAQLVLTIVVIGLLMTFFRGNVNVSAHLFGLASGFAISPLLFGAKRYRPSYSAGGSFNWRSRKKIGFQELLWVLLILLVLIGMVARF